jgi:predicted alpha/beta hydrolase family esterase
MRFAEENKIQGSVLVGTYYTYLGYEDEKTSGYFDAPWNWEAIKQNQKWVIVFASKDDPYITIDEPRLIKEKLGADYFEFDNQGHFGEGKSKKDFPELLKALKEKLGKV